MSRALSVDRVVKVTVNLQPLAAARRNFGILLIVGSSGTISQSERIRSYTGIEGVTEDFGIYSPEHIAAELFFSQTPRPSILQIGRWVKTPVPGILQGGILSDIETDLSAWTKIKDGSLTVSVGGVSATVSDIDLSEAITLEGIAHIVSEALREYGARVAYDGSRFSVTSIATGAAATVGYATGSLAEKMRLTEETALLPVPGMDSETPKECVAALADKSGDWYGLVFADASLTVQDHIEVSGLIEASAKSRIYGVTTTDSRTLDKEWTQDVASRLNVLKRKRTMVAYSQHPYAVISAIGRAFTVNFNANKSTITLKFKQLPGIVAESLGESQAKALEVKRCNVFAAYDNDSAIYQEGVMSGDAFFDEIHGLDWLQNAVQNECWNLPYQSKTKVPQTDSGVNQIITAIEGVMGDARTNQLIAPGVWNADGFGQLERGDYLDKGYYTYAGRVDAQPQSERERRKAPPIQVAVKMAGAIHDIDVIINVNR